MSNPRISIVMAAKNVEPYIKECLDSIIEQSFDNWELIAVDDHSNDRTAEIIKEYQAKDTRIHYFLSEGKKLNPALITAQKHIKGELLNRMDADDIMPSYKLAVLLEAWEKKGKGHVVAGGTKHFVETGEVGEGFLRYDAWLNEVARKGSHYREIYRECVIPSHCWLIHKDDFFNVGGFEDIYPEDYDLCFKFYQAQFKIVPLDKVLHYWRDRTDRISRTWEEYKDNRYFELKLKYLFKIDRDLERPLVVWGAGRNGKDLIKLIHKQESSPRWVCNNEKKIGKDIYGIKLESENSALDIENPQILVVVSNPSERSEIKKQLTDLHFIEGKHFWFFL